jgi:acetyltransferase-like isoleucine patch superfamily enzyme
MSLFKPINFRELPLRLGSRIPGLQIYCAPALTASRRGFYTVGELVRKSQREGFTVISPTTNLISRGVVIGKGTIIHPNVTIQRGSGKIIIGRNNQLFPNLTIDLKDQASVRIGNNNELGHGGGGVISTFIGGSKKDGDIVIGSETRLTRGFEVLGGSKIGSGSQILGAAIVSQSSLGEGRSYKFPRDEQNPQGAVVKGPCRVYRSELKPGSVVHPNINLNGSVVERNREIKPA